MFDVSFSSLVTTRVIKFLYVLSMIMIGLGALFFVVAAFTRSAVAGVIVLLIVAPLFSLLYLVYVRVLLEIVIVIFRIMESNIELVALQRSAASPSRTAPPSSPVAPSTSASGPPASAPPMPPPPASPPPSS